MQLATPEGTLTIDDDRLTFKPSDDGPELSVSLTPMPDYKYERGVYGVGGLVIGGHYIVLRNEQSSTVVEELRRPRAEARPVKAAQTVKSDSDSAKAK